MPRSAVISKCLKKKDLKDLRHTGKTPSKSQEVLGFRHCDLKGVLGLSF